MEQVRGSIVVSISACHAEDPGSIPGRGVFALLSMHFSLPHCPCEPSSANGPPVARGTQTSSSHAFSCCSVGARKGAHNREISFSHSSAGLRKPLRNTRAYGNLAHEKSTARGFEPLRAEPNGFLVHHLNHSVTLSTPRMCGACILSCSSRAVLCTPCVRVPKSWKQTRSPHVSRQRCSRYRLLDLI